MTTSSSTASGTGRRLFAVFVRLVAVLVGLMNLAVLVKLADGYSALQRGTVGWSEVLPSVLVAVVAGLLTAAAILKWLKPSALGEEFSDRCGAVMIAVCLGGIVMGGLLAAMLTLNGALLSPPTILERIFMSLVTGFLGALFGLAIGFLESLFLAPPLAAILGRSKARG